MNELMFLGGRPEMPHLPGLQLHPIANLMILANSSLRLSLLPNFRQLKR
ncbi:hypothetical protein Rahaq2_0630 [Rahnella aquatilis CIP 78.65 = ATCC 33071]|uniref:Uncharacterized protein n=1 Tax=Rahnella aquatilis (strain ATCC 33071 / DSM 4594 / JCM 1683 / NBRC 105701 / NCIMB 13365 / CIP 78.65) TaxID=745277 RepID=H2IUG3_RAHAC|nr:hypothetical protein Rahaq2_0630 [Rahnella aquatilis CIP 78.65 = ATCC 33071]